VHAELQLPASIESGRLARAFTAEWMGQRADSPETIQVACLVVSELVSSAVTNGAQSASLRLTDHGDSVRIEVEDGDSPKLDRQTEAKNLALRIVQQLSSDRGTRRTEHGQTNWADVSLR